MLRRSSLRDRPKRGQFPVSEVLGKSKTLILSGPSSRLSDLLVLLPVGTTRLLLPHTTVAPAVATEVGGATAWMGPMS